MDFSIKSLLNISAEGKDSKKANREMNRDNDTMSKIVNAIRIAMEGNQSLNINDVVKKSNKGAFAGLKFNKEELRETLTHYEKLQVIYIDNDENIFFL
mmetsp:Transcript_45926/g.33672  ORF Transcript_45926/g.33672 Transcript_45926/m.33672 type:complete len:98 (+) Transcript_45926:2044-2337(+)